MDTGLCERRLGDVMEGIEVLDPTEEVLHPTVVVLVSDGVLDANDAFDRIGIWDSAGVLSLPGVLDPEVDAEQHLW